MRRILLSDLPPGHPASEFVPAIQAIVVIGTLAIVLLIVSITLKEYNFFWVRRRLMEASEHDREAKYTLKVIKEMVLIAKDHRVKTSNLLDKVDKRVEEMHSAGESSSSSLGTIPTVKPPGA